MLSDLNRNEKKHRNSVQSSRGLYNSVARSAPSRKKNTFINAPERDAGLSTSLTRRAEAANTTFVVVVTAAAPVVVDVGVDLRSFSASA